MLSFKIGLPQYKNSPPKAQIPAYFQKILDTHSFVGIITQPLSHSATQQLSNSRRKGGLCSDKRAACLFRQQHHHYFSLFFADGKRTVNLFRFKPQRVPSMRRQIEENIPFKTLELSVSFAAALRNKPLSIQRSQIKIEKRFNKNALFRFCAGSAYFAVTLRTKPVKNVQNSKGSGINLVPHNYTLQIIHYRLLLALYRKSRPAVWFDSG